MLNQIETLLRLENVGKKHGRAWSVRGVSLNLLPGQIVTLIGPNGSGKSTTAKLVAGIDHPTEGSVIRQPQLRIGYVPQKLAIDWSTPLTVGRFMTLTHRLDTRAVEHALETTGVCHLISAELRTLSGGELQRVMLARAISRKPNLLVLDEPAQGVDVAGELALYELIKATRDDLGCAVLLVSHDLHFVMSATDHVICLNKHICCEGPPQLVAATQQYASLFGDRAVNGLALYHHQHGHVHLPDGRVQHASGVVTDSCLPPSEPGNANTMPEAGQVDQKEAPFNAAP